MKSAFVTIGWWRMVSSPRGSDRSTATARSTMHLPRCRRRAWKRCWNPCRLPWRSQAPGIRAPLYAKGLFLYHSSIFVRIAEYSKLFWISRLPLCLTTIQSTCCACSAAPLVYQRLVTGSKIGGTVSAALFFATWKNNTWYGLSTIHPSVLLRRVLSEEQMDRLRPIAPWLGASLLAFLVAYPFLCIARALSASFAACLWWTDSDEWALYSYGHQRHLYVVP